MSYNDYKQQYAYGFAPVALNDLGALSSSSTKFYLGEAFGPKANLSKTTNDLTHTKPLDFKAAKQMFYKKAVLDIEVIESIAPLGTKQTLTIAYNGTAGAAGSSVWHIWGESPVTVSIESGTTATNAGKAAVAALAGLVNWTASESSGTVTLTRKVEAANITATDTTKFSVTDISSTTQTLGGQTSGSASFTAGTTGVAPEADAHNIKLDFYSADEAGLDAYIAGGNLDPDMTVFVKSGEAVVCNTPYFQSLMPSDTKEFSWVEISCPYAGTASITFTSGKLLIHCNPN